MKHCVEEPRSSNPTRDQFESPGNDPSPRAKPPLTGASRSLMNLSFLLNHGEGDDQAEEDVMETMDINQDPRNDFKQKGHIRKEKKTAPQKRHRKRQKDELLYLRKRLDELNGQLEELLKKERRMEDGNHSSKTYWESQARCESRKRQESERENTLMKQRLVRQTEFLVSIRDALSKNPKLSSIQILIDCQDPPFTRLPLNPAKRWTMLHQLADFLYKKSSTWIIEVGYLETREDARFMQLYEHKRDDVEALVTNHKKIPFANYKVLSEMVWKSLSGQRNEAFEQSLHSKVLEIVDENTCYVRYVDTGLTKQLAGVPYVFTTVVKRYKEVDRVTIIMQSVTDDQLHPVPKQCFCAQHSFVIVFAQDINPQNVIFHGILRVKKPILSSPMAVVPSGVVVTCFSENVLEKLNSFEQMMESIARSMIT